MRAEIPLNAEAQAASVGAITAIKMTLRQKASPELLPSQ